MSLSVNSRGAALMSLAMAGFTCNDALVKILTSDLNTGQIMFVRGFITTCFVYAIARYTGTLVHVRSLMHPLILLRTFFEVAGTVTFLSALQRMPLANVSAILQSLPLAVTLGAALFLRETVGWRRWSAILVGFLGVMIIIRPGPEGFTAAALFAIASTICTASRDLITRRIPQHIPSLSITVLTALANAVCGLVLIVPLGGWQPVSSGQLATLAAAAVLLMVGYQSVVLAMRVGDISFVAPFRYTSLLWALALGFMLFGDVPDTPVLIGAAIVIGSGLYSFYRERRRGRPVPAPAGGPSAS